LSFCTFSFSHCVVCSSLTYRFWLPLWYLQALLTIFRRWTQTPMKSKQFLFLIRHLSCYSYSHRTPLSVIKETKPLCCLFFFDIQILITPLVSSSSSYYFNNTLLLGFITPKLFVGGIMSYFCRFYSVRENTITEMSVKIVHSDKTWF
jgi:hypothetical protein